MSLLNEVKKWYFDITRYYEESGYNKSYELNTFWKGGNFAIVRDILDQSNDEIDFTHKIQGTVLYQLTTGNDYKHNAIQYQLDLLLKNGIDFFKLPDFVQESEYMRQDHVVEIKGRKVTTDFFRYLNSVLLIEKYKKDFEEHPLIMELGAGTGNFARLLKLFIPNSTYIIIDIPETIIFSYIFIKLNFPKLKILLASSEKDLIGKNSKDYDFIFAPTKFAEIFITQKVDLFINMASLGEMTNPVIKYWMNFIQNDLRPKSIYTLNRYLNVFVPHLQDDYRKDENTCSVLYDKNWDIKYWQLDSECLKCPYDFTRHARYLEIFAFRVQNSTESSILESDKIINEISKQDWHREFNSSQGDKIVQFRMHVLSYDTSSSGIIFKLWNSLRLNPNNKSALKAIIKYLYIITPGGYAEFEEYFFYKQKFLSCFVESDDDDRNFLEWLKLRDVELLYNPYITTDIAIRSVSPEIIYQKPIDNFVIEGEVKKLLEKLLRKDRKKKKMLRVFHAAINPRKIFNKLKEVVVNLKNTFNKIK